MQNTELQTLTFKPGNRYRHRNCLDIDLNVEKILGESDELISLIVCYWNRHMDFPQGPMPDVVRVKKSDLSNWALVGPAIKSYKTL